MRPSTHHDSSNSSETSSEIICILGANAFHNAFHPLLRCVGSSSPAWNHGAALRSLRCFSGRSSPSSPPAVNAVKAVNLARIIQGSNTFQLIRSKYVDIPQKIAIDGKNHGKNMGKNVIPCRFCRCVFC